jgi:hypothetical protein
MDKNNFQNKNNNGKSSQGTTTTQIQITIFIQKQQKLEQTDLIKENRNQSRKIT